MRRPPTVLACHAAREAAGSLPEALQQVAVIAADLLSQKLPQQRGGPGWQWARSPAEQQLPLRNTMEPALMDSNAAAAWEYCHESLVPCIWQI